MIPADESIILRDSAPAGMQKVLIHKLRIRGDFREASDWLSHGKSHPNPDGFSVPPVVSRIIPVTIPGNCSIKGLVRSRVKEYYWVCLSSG
jgi:hypothetical protein